MSVLDTFVQFTDRLPSERLSSVEAALAEIMASHSAQYDFSLPELTLIDQRVAAEAPEYSASDDITKLFGKPFSG
jgi:hypothetical protein